MMSWEVYGLCLLLLFLRRTVDVASEPVVSDERRLINQLLSRYEAQGKVARPVLDSSHTVNVQFGIRLVHLDLDEKEQVMKTSAWVRMAWLDEFLNWQPAEFGGVTTINIPADNIWIPDLALVNTAETSVSELAGDVVVKYTGDVLWAPERKYTSACLIDVTEYPYDRHTCEMWFQSISNRGSSLNITAYHGSPLDLDTYLTSYKHAQEWAILANETTWHERPRDVGMILMWSRRPSLRFSLTVQRRAGFKGMLLIVPCTLLSFVMPLIFCLPPERPDRHTLAMSLFSSLTVLLFMVTEVAPPSASFVPKLALYYCFNLLILLLATCCSTIVINLSKRGETREKVPKVVKVVFIKGVGRCLCFGRRLKHLSAVKQSSRRTRQNSRSPTETVPLHDLETGSNNTSAVPETYPAQACGAPGDSRDLAALSAKLGAIQSQLAARSSPRQPEVPDTSIPVDLRMEWRTLSLVLDKLFFVLFLSMDFISLGAFHPRMP